MAESTPPHDNAQQAVRFSSVTQEISPATQDDSVDLVKTKTTTESPERLTEEQRKEIRELSMSLQQSRMQTNRMNQFVFDPISLPPSRVSLPLNYGSYFASDPLYRFPLVHHQPKSHQPQLVLLPVVRLTHR
jgi:hypothetical protein